MRRTLETSLSKDTDFLRAKILRLLPPGDFSIGEFERRLCELLVSSPSSKGLIPSPDRRRTLEIILSKDTDFLRANTFRLLPPDNSSVGEDEFEPFLRAFSTIHSLSLGPTPSPERRRTLKIILSKEVDFRLAKTLRLLPCGECSVSFVSIVAILLRLRHVAFFTCNDGLLSEEREPS